MTQAILVAQPLGGGFASPAFDAAHAFRAAMRAMARPGTIERTEGAAPPAPMSRAMGAVLLTLCDPDTPIHLAGAHDTPPLRGWITFHTGAPLVEAAQADFAFGTWDSLQPVTAYRVGTPQYPNRSTTLVVDVENLQAKGARLTGPGIKETAWLNLPETKAFQANRKLFPLGLDCFFTAGDQLAALPRTTHVREAD
jgi:alpha-D-ribose 1-methylphosphonate 5-triphosphate synthase subunit PhnH